MEIQFPTTFFNYDYENDNEFMKYGVRSLMDKEIIWWTLCSIIKNAPVK